MTTVEVRGLAVHFGAVRAVDGVDLDIHPGEFHGVIGPNGAGKSTFIDAVSGRTRATRGTVSMDGRDITLRSPGWRRRSGMSRSFQLTSVFARLTVRQQLELVARELSDDRLDEIVEWLELSPLLDRVCEETSYGDQRLIDLALALLGRPSVLLLDEPAAGLTAAETETVVSRVRDIADRRGIAVVLVEHDVQAVFSTCTRVTVLDRGAVLTTGSPADVRSDERVITAYLGSSA